ncbi:MAG: hypothetical protein WBF53_05625 [Litorimonas sp.]
MRFPLIMLASTLIAMGLSACASTPNPDVVCTAEWVDARADRALDRIGDKSSKALDAFQDAGKTWLSGGSPGPLQLWRLSNAVKALEDELTDGKGVRDLRTLARTCNDPDLVRTRITSFLTESDIPDPVVRFLGGSGLIDQLIRTAEGNAPSDARR